MSAALAIVQSWMKSHPALRCFGFGALGSVIVGGLFVAWVYTRVINDSLPVDGSIVWQDTVKEGTMEAYVLGWGTIVRAEGTEHLFARLMVDDRRQRQLKLNQECELDIGKASVKGHIEWMADHAAREMRGVDAAFDEAMPGVIAEGSEVNGRFAIRELKNVLYVGRPVHGEPFETVTMFRYADDGLWAERVEVKLGEESRNEIQVLSGLKPGDKVILSDMSLWDGVDRIRLR